MSEKKVQKEAQEYLKRKYSWRALGKPLYGQLEARTKRKHGNKRADGLLVFHHLLWGEFVVSMEAKSYKTLSAIKTYHDERSHLLGSLKWGFYVLLLSGTWLALFRQEFYFYKLLFPIVFFLLGALIFALLTRHSPIHKMSAVIKQIRQYPANHQWLAISKDSFLKLSGEKRKQLKRSCRQQGIGILVISKWGKQILVKPKMQWKKSGHFLDHYSKAKEIRTYLQ